MQVTYNGKLRTFQIKTQTVPTHMQRVYTVTNLSWLFFFFWFKIKTNAAIINVATCLDISFLKQSSQLLVNLKQPSVLFFTWKKSALNNTRRKLVNYWFTQQAGIPKHWESNIGILFAIHIYLNRHTVRWRETGK